MDLSFNLALSYRYLKHPTSRQNVEDTPGQIPELILTLRHMWLAVECPHPPLPYMSWGTHCSNGCAPNTCTESRAGMPRHNTFPASHSAHSRHCGVWIVQTHTHRNANTCVRSHTPYCNILWLMNCLYLLRGVMCDNQVCNLLRSYRGPLACIRLIYYQLYLTIIAGDYKTCVKEFNLTLTFISLGILESLSQTTCLGVLSCQLAPASFFG